MGEMRMKYCVLWMYASFSWLRLSGSMGVHTRRDRVAVDDDDKSAAQPSAHSVDSPHAKSARFIPDNMKVQADQQTIL